jgi:hypothetical protein
VEDLTAEEKIDAAFEAAREKLGGVDRLARRDHLWEQVVEGSHRDGMTRILRYQSREK